MGEMISKAVEILGDSEFTMLYDKGYHTGSEFTKAEESEVEVLVAIPAIPSESEFVYNEKDDIYLCPEGQVPKPAPSTYTYKDASKPEYSYNDKVIQRMSESR